MSACACHEMGHDDVSPHVMHLIFLSFLCGVCVCLCVCVCMCVCVCVCVRVCVCAAARSSLRQLGLPVSLPTMKVIGYSTRSGLVHSPFLESMDGRHGRDLETPLE